MSETTSPRERPILFSGPMVRALLEGRKTQTRRAVKLPHQNPLGVWEPFIAGGGKSFLADGSPAPELVCISHTRTGDTLACPHGQSGDRLWVRETWSHTGEGVWSIADARKRLGGHPIYAATHDGPKPLGWWPSIHMPREFSRITLEVTDVRVERLQDISERDAKAEGIIEYEPTMEDDAEYAFEEGGIILESARAAFEYLWERINSPGSWKANPWVWAVSFRVLAPTQQKDAA